MDWSGDRIIVVGEYQSESDLPPSLVSYVKQLKAEHKPRGWEEREDRGNLNLYKLSDSFTAIRPRWNHLDTHGLALRNLVKLEYVKMKDFGCECFFDAFLLLQNHTLTNLISVPPDYYNPANPGLAEILVQKITWSTDTSTNCGYDDPVWPGALELCRGSWAGDRFDLVEEDFDWEGDVWIDVGEKVIREVFQLYRDDGSEIRGRDR